MTSAEFASKEGKQAEGAPKEEPKEEKTEEKPVNGKSDIGESEESSDDEEEKHGEGEEVNDEEGEEEDNETPEEDDGAKLTSEPSNLKMFFISPFEKNSAEEEPSTRQILTYPAKSHGWGHTHQFGPSHIWNSDYPYFAYGYSWGCGHHGYGEHGHVKKSDVKENSLCRDYVLIPAVSQAPAVLAPNGQNGVARNYVSKDIACDEGDTDCARRQVIGSMAGGSMFGDGMGGLGLGFPGVPGIHTGISGYNMAGGFGDHIGHGGSHGGNAAGHHSHHHGGHGGHYGVGHGGAHSYFFPSGEHGIPSFWSARADIPNAEGFFGGARGSTFFHGEDILPIHEAADGVGSGHGYGIGSGQWWDKTPNFRNYGLGADASLEVRSTVLLEEAMEMVLESVVLTVTVHDLEDMEMDTELDTEPGMVWVMHMVVVVDMAATVAMDTEVSEEDMELPADMELMEMAMALEVTVMLFWVVT